MHHRPVRSSCKLFHFSYASSWASPLRVCDRHGCQPPSRLRFTALCFLTSRHATSWSSFFLLPSLEGHAGPEIVSQPAVGVVTSLPAGIEGFRLRGRSERRIPGQHATVVRRKANTETAGLTRVARCSCSILRSITIHSFRSCSRGPGTVTVVGASLACSGLAEAFSTFPRAVPRRPHHTHL